MKHVVIVRIDDREIIYEGTCLYTAATYLDPGCCFAVGEGAFEAASKAMSEAEQFRSGVHV